MKAISVKQPWANLIANGEKTIETRKWATPYRGQILIVSSKTPKIEPAGFALAVADIIDCRIMTKEDEVAACCQIYADAYSWVLSNVRPIQPIQIKGSLGIYDVPVDSVTLKVVERTLPAKSSQQELF